MKVLACASAVGTTIAEIRLAMPLAALVAQRGGSLELRDLWDVRPADLDAADVLVMQRPVSRRALTLMHRMRASGGKVVCELDDLLTEPAEHLTGHARALRLAVRVRRALAVADVVTASTPRLADALRPLARAVHVVPNYAWPYPVARTPSGSGPVHVLLAASDRVAATSLTQALAQVCAARPGALALVAVGPAAEVLERAGLPFRAEPLMPRAAFVRFAAALPRALAAIPLGRTPFDACKSAIKWFDYAVAGVPAICSAVPPYADVIDDGRTGRLVDDDAAAWRAALLEALDDPARAHTWAEAARAEVGMRHTLEQTCAAWGDVLAALGPRRASPRVLPPWLRAWDSAAVRLHDWNAARLAERRQRREVPR